MDCKNCFCIYWEKTLVSLTPLHWIYKVTVSTVFTLILMKLTLLCKESVFSIGIQKSIEHGIYRMQKKRIDICV